MCFHSTVQIECAFKISVITKQYENSQTFSQLQICITKTKTKINYMYSAAINYSHFV